jgi:hypothetical protein
MIYYPIPLKEQEAFKQIGNAVPPILAAFIGREIACNIFNRPKKSLREIIDLLGQKHLFKEDISDV